ncbi:MAG: hypothetical protein GKR89_03915 [Candidatus Latescibacteria bacterium]|nr:hypothetical protein [Candidatus Latescibacterota bacterium]
MERLFPNLYRVSTPNKKETSHTYLLQRQAGNLLVCHNGGPSAEDLDEIERLGGIDSQWVCHQHDVNRNGVHEDLYARFGCKLHHHRREKGVRKKTQCPVVPFGDEGLKQEPDFEALYYPSCMDGHSLFRWRHRDQYFLFTSHAFYLRENTWHISVPMPSYRRDLLRPQFAQIAKLQVDYVLPGYTAPQEDTFYRLNEQTKQSFSEALRGKAQAI